MTEQEAIKFLTGYLDSVVYKEKCVEAHKLAIKALEEIQKYEAIGTPEECRAAVEKQRAKIPKEYEDKFYGCPTCGNVLLHKFGTPPSRNPTLTATDGMHHPGCG